MQAFKGPNMFLTTMTAKLFDDMGFYIGNLFIQLITIMSNHLDSVKMQVVNLF